MTIFDDWFERQRGPRVPGAYVDEIQQVARLTMRECDHEWYDDREVQDAMPMQVCGRCGLRKIEGCDHQWEEISEIGLPAEVETCVHCGKERPC